MKREAKLRQRSNTREGTELPSPSSTDLPQLGSDLTVEHELSPETTELISRITSTSQQAALVRDEAMASLSVFFVSLIFNRYLEQIRSNTREGTELPSPSSTDLPQLGSDLTVEHELSPETTELISRITSTSQQAALVRDEAMASLSTSAPSSAFQQLAELTILEAQHVHEVVRQLPGFSRLCEDDRRTVQKVKEIV
ncbi:unnamed protein product [Cylicostephanus goldi]|uniref:Uncharacterized protein n=1 Tax=Cylicostephanus goldi TaxID=71465 RepID=A0A3P7NMM8_CYLGO|nr:unnamed protein product [Cylicostephanus goldi]